MDLDLDIAPRTRGRAAVPLQADLVRELIPADLALLATERGVQAPAVKRLKASHHALARCLAAGMKPGEAGMATGYSASRVSILQADPSFNELVQLYMSEATSQYEAGMEAMRSLHLDSVELLHERVLDELIETPDLIRVVEKTADRIGMGPKSTSVQVNVDLSARLEAARRRAGMGQAPASAVLDLTPNREEPDV